MKKSIALLLAVFMVVALFAGCGGSTTANNTTTTTDNPGGTTTEAPSTTTTNPPEESTPTEAPVEQDPNSPYHFAPGTYQTDADGIPTAPYEYTLPLSTTNEILTMWTTCYSPELIPEEGYGALPYQAGLREMTGVNIEYDLVTFTSMNENFSVKLASDDLDDIMVGATRFYTGPAKEMVEDGYGYFVNLYNYKEYMPAYLYMINRLDDPLLRAKRKATMFYDDETILGFGVVIENPMPGQGYVARRDWAEKLGVDMSTINTYDEVHDLMTLFKNEMGATAPFAMFKSIELTYANFAGGYDTAAYIYDGALPMTRQVNGEVQYTATTPDDLAFMTMLNQWYNDGLIDPAWASYSSTLDMNTSITTGKIGCFPENPSVLPTYEAATEDPDVNWDALPKFRQTENQVLHYGGPSNVAIVPSTSIAQTCANIPLAVTYLDWAFTDSASDYMSYGPEGVTYTYDENGERMLTDFILTHPSGAAWVLCVYAMNGLSGEPGRLQHIRSMAYEGGDRFLNMMLMWKEDTEDAHNPSRYDGAYDMPSDIKYTDEQNEDLKAYTTDLNTYILENYLAFVDNSKPLSEWDSYVEGLHSMGLDECQAIVQEAYETYLANLDI